MEPVTDIAELDYIDTPEDKDDQWEEIVSAGLMAQENMDVGRWTIGDLATLVNKSYGEDRIGLFAQQIKIEVASVKTYRTVATFYEKALRSDFDGCEALCFSHFREAMRLKDKRQVKDFLFECNDNAYSVERARIELAKRLGKPEPARKLYDGTVLISPLDAMPKTRVAFEVDANTRQQLADYYATGKRVVRLVVYEVKE